MADLLIAPLTVLYRRALYIDFLPPIGQTLIGMYISSESSKESVNFLTSSLKLYSIHEIFQAHSFFTKIHKYILDQGFDFPVKHPCYGKCFFLNNFM